MPVQGLTRELKQGAALEFARQKSVAKLGKVDFADDLKMMKVYRQ